MSVVKSKLPSDDEIFNAMAKARQLRAQAMRDGARRVIRTMAQLGAFARNGLRGGRSASAS
ncbi:MAG: hypothetical protein AAF367_16360 [Pseudomonadota bacterium]